MIKKIVLFPVFLVGTVLMLIGAFGVTLLSVGENIMRKIGAL